jgi:hypothetical protein
MRRIDNRRNGFSVLQRIAVFADVPDEIPGGSRRSKRACSEHAMTHRKRFFAVVTVNTGSRVLLGKRVFGPLRLPDVKPPCSNLAGTSVPASFFMSCRILGICWTYGEQLFRRQSTRDTARRFLPASGCPIGPVSECDSARARAGPRLLVGRLFFSELEINEWPLDERHHSEPQREQHADAAPRQSVCQPTRERGSQSPAAEGVVDRDDR